MIALGEYKDLNAFNYDKDSTLVIDRATPLSELGETICDLTNLVKPGKQLLISVSANTNDLEEMIKNIYQSIPWSEFKLSNSYHLLHDHVGGDSGNACICLTKLFDLQDIKKCNDYLSVGNQDYITRKMNLPDEHFLYSLYPDALQHIYLPLGVHQQLITVPLLIDIYNCSKEDAISLWNDLYAMQIENLDDVEREKGGF